MRVLVAGWLSHFRTYIIKVSDGCLSVLMRPHLLSSTGATLDFVCMYLQLASVHLDLGGACMVTQRHDRVAVHALLQPHEAAAVQAQLGHAACPKSTLIFGCLRLMTYDCRT